jgi:Predicted periplasmic lipoprotein (DUF2279)
MNIRTGYRLPFLLTLNLLLSTVSLPAQNFFKASTRYNPGRVNGMVITESAIGTAVTIGLQFLWYKKFPHSKFHLFNDNAEWLQVDKVGHATTAYNIAAFQSNLMRWGGIRSGTAALIGTLTALGFMTMIEVMDGHSTKWGFSKGDMLANIAGCVLFEGQQLLWHEQRISLKYSYHGTLFPQYYPAELGGSLPERMLKDYNGQSYWLSFNIASFLPASSHFPRWLNATVGYGAEGMVGAMKNPDEVDGKPIPSFKRYRQFYFSFDTDLYRVNGLSPLASSLLEINRVIKTPAPALEWNEVGGIKFHPFYY